GAESAFRGLAERTNTAVPAALAVALHVGAVGRSVSVVVDAIIARGARLRRGARRAQAARAAGFVLAVRVRTIGAAVAVVVDPVGAQALRLGAGTTQAARPAALSQAVGVI